MIYWKSEARHLTFCGYMTLDTSNWGSIYEVKRSNVKVTGNKNVKKSFFAHIIVKTGLIHVKPKPKRSPVIFYTYHRIYFTCKMRHFAIFVCLSVCHIVFIDSELEWRRKFLFYGEITCFRHFLYFCIFMQLSFKYRKNFTHYATATKLCISRSHRHIHYRTMEQGIYHIAMSMLHFALFLPRDAL